LGGIFLLLSVLFTETGLTVIGTQVAYLLRPSTGGLTQPTYEAIVAIAKALSVLSPHHVGARVVGISFGLTNFWADFHVVVPAAAQRSGSPSKLADRPFPFCPRTART